MRLGRLEHRTSLNSFESSSLKRKRNLQNRATAATPSSCLGEGIRSLIQEGSEREGGIVSTAVPAPTTQSVRCVVVSKGAVVKTCYTSNALPKDYIPSVQQL